jgi:hypothetical protein
MFSSKWTSHHITYLKHKVCHVTCHRSVVFVQLLWFPPPHEDLRLTRPFSRLVEYCNSLDMETMTQKASAIN